MEFCCIERAYIEFLRSIGERGNRLAVMEDHEHTSFLGNLGSRFTVAVVELWVGRCFVGFWLQSSLGFGVFCSGYDVQ